jgi:manganese transport protein
MGMREKMRRAFTGHVPGFRAWEALKFIGPGFLVTVGFIDPGNWASNVAAGSLYGYRLLWMVTLSTIMLILLQHNAAHLGISTGLCISEAATRHLRPFFSRFVLLSAVVAAISTALAEILGGAIGLSMLFGIPLPVGAVAVTLFVFWMLFTNTYGKIEKVIIAFVSLIGLSFLYEIILVDVSWGSAGAGWVTPSFPPGSIPIVMSVLGAVVMPHNLYLHSEFIQSRQINLKGEDVVRKRLRYEFVDTLASMIVGWAINSAMILLAAATFHARGVVVTELGQAHDMLHPMLGGAAAAVFGGALLLAGLSSSVTAGMAGGSIVAGLFGEHYDTRDSHTQAGIAVTLVGALLAVFLVSDPFRGLILSQVALSIQLPWTIVLLILLTSSRKVMGEHANTTVNRIVLWIVAAVVIAFNVALLADFVFP